MGSASSQAILVAGTFMHSCPAKTLVGFCVIRCDAATRTWGSDEDTLKSW